MRAMYESQTPKWLTRLERRMGWLAFPNISIILVTLQAAGFLFVLNNPQWRMNLALFPELVLQGELWRVITFLALPLTMSPLFVIFVLWFLYFIVNAIENQWGAFRTTFYVLISVCLTVAYSFTFSYPVMQASHFQSSLFLAAAALFPEMEIRLFLVLPVKMKWLAWLTIAFIFLQFGTGTWLDRGYLIAIFSNYLIFFGKAHYWQMKQAYRRYDYKRRMR
jgi:hypothetical protein